MTGTRLYRLPYNSTVQVVLQNTGIIALKNHPIYLHGFNFFVVGRGLGNFNSKKDTKKFNLVDPVERNTIGEPSGGWTAIRFRADNLRCLVLALPFGSAYFMGAQDVLYLSQLKPTPGYDCGDILASSSTLLTAMANRITNLAKKSSTPSLPPNRGQIKRKIFKTLVKTVIAVVSKAGQFGRKSGGHCSGAAALSMVLVKDGCVCQVSLVVVVGKGLWVLRVLKEAMDSDFSVSAYVRVYEFSFSFFWVSMLPDGKMRET
ncbi:hypothetical protein HHK36_010871 [Tetracentron sinense]|uniref:Plastocyanin-like domain-containing protein n=1 Tax=Tetracentron sinense TaxID=13715 RepID=A0A834ZBA9_TETSI|nr:hypothetical protein HHK36_010871 [Tetracentron sinense]